MTHEYNRKPTLARVASFVAAALMTLSVGGFIDLLAFSHVTDSQQTSRSARSCGRTCA